MGSPQAFGLSVEQLMPRAEHGLYEYELDAGGQRLSTRLPENYFPMMRDYLLRGTIAPSYGDAVVVLPNRR